MEKMRRLPDTELEVMLVLWEAEGEVPRTGISTPSILIFPGWRKRGFSSVKKEER